MHEILEDALHRGRVGMSYLIEGNSTARITHEADGYLRSLFCDHGTGCGQCGGCKKFDNASHMDLFKVTGTKIDEVRGLPDFAALHPFEAKVKAVYIPRVDLLNELAQNTLLKTIEEPLGDTVVVLGACNIHAVLPTILSRCIVLKASIDGENALQRLMTKTLLKEDQARVILQAAGGDFGGAMELAQNRFLDIRNDAAEAMHRLLLARTMATSKIEKLLWHQDGANLASALRAALMCLSDILSLKYIGPQAPLQNEDIRDLLARDVVASPRRIVIAMDGLHHLLENMSLCLGLNKSLALQSALLGILEGFAGKFVA